MKSKWNYIGASICFIFVIIKTYIPSLIEIIKDKIDRTSLIFICVGMFLILYKYNVRFINKIYDKISLRIFLSLFCLSLVVIKVFNNKLIIDNTSIYLIVISIIVAVIPELTNTFQRITKVKTGEFELEFNLNSLSSQIDKVEKEVEESKESSELNYGGIDRETKERLELISADPSALILIIGIEIENRLRKLNNAVINDRIRFLKLFDLMKELADKKILNNSQIDMLDQFRKVKNKVSHGVEMNDITSEKLYEIANLGLRILQTLPTEIIK